jgi:tRNA (guanine10-N2)-dimethyltransferase
LLIEGADAAPQLQRIIGKARYKLKVFRLSPRRIDIKKLGEEITKKLEGKVSLDNPEYEISIVSAKTQHLILTKPETMNQFWTKRRPRARPYFHPSALYPKLARAMVNLSSAAEGSVLLDPFVGTGSILLEASMVGIEGLGLDISRSMLAGAKRNLEQFGSHPLGLIRGDARHLPLSGVDTIVTDVPYGRASSSLGHRTEDLLESVVESGSRLISKGKRIVIMHPETVPITAPTYFDVEEEHSLYVHRKLTRIISVLKRNAT